MENKSLLKSTLVVVLITVILLMIPFVAMQFDSGVDWSPLDFVVMGVILFSAGFTYVLISRMSKSTPYRAGVAFAVFAAFMLVWVNMAVGIIGDGRHLINVLFFLVPLIALLGAGMARFQADGAARGSVFAGLTQILIPLGAWILGIGNGIEFVLTSFLAMLWLISALLFLRAAKDEAREMAESESIEILKRSQTTYLVALGLLLVGVICGVGGVWVAEIDDAPGAALIGVGILAVGVYSGFKSLKV